MEGIHPKPHAIMVPLPLQGHINPSVNLALKLASHGFTITYVNTEANHQHMAKAQLRNSTNGPDIFLKARKSGLDIRYATVSDGLPLAFDRSLNRAQFMESLLHVFSAHIDDLVGNIVHHTNTLLTCLIADGAFVWASMIAKKYNLVHVSFWTQPALVFTLYYHWDLLRSNGHLGCHGNREDIIDYIPGVDSIQLKDLPSNLQAANPQSVIPRMLYKAFEDVRNADFIIGNTVQELEPETVSALQREQPFYPIGPIFPNGLAEGIVGTSLWSESQCKQWLNTKTHGSVLYISFGSYAHCSKKDIEEIAHGILLSKVSFIWVVRPDIVSSDETDVLPAGFEEKIKDQGLIVPWCCQIEAISHPSVGGFLTHCGWNSILESIWCNVPLLCFPLLSDQPTNRKLVVDDWRAGLTLCERKIIRRDEVAVKINRLMSGKSSNDLKNNMKKIKKKLENAISSSVGSSEKNFRQFLEDMEVKVQTKQREALCSHN